jgi:hypothetical protein
MTKISAVRCVHCGSQNELRLTKENLKGAITCRGCRREFPAFEAAIVAAANPVTFARDETVTAVRRINRPRAH